MSKPYRGWMVFLNGNPYRFFWEKQDAINSETGTRADNCRIQFLKVKIEIDTDPLERPAIVFGK